LTLLVSWVAFPLLLAALSAGCGLLVEAIGGARLPTAMLLPVGLAAIVAVGSFSLGFAPTAKLTAPLIAALAAAGFVLGRPRVPDRLALVAAAAVFVAYGAPVLLSGTATFAGYIKLDDTATFLALTDRMMEHGRSLAGLAPSSYEATLSVNLAHGYPLGSLVPLGIGSKLMGTDPAWLYQPWLSFCGAMLALALYELASPVIRRRPLRALAVFVSAQPALLFGYAQWGGVKELAGAALIATAAAAVGTTRSPLGPRALVPFAVACAAVIDALSSAGVVWLLPLVVAVTLAARKTRVALATGAAVAVALAVPALVTLADFLRGANRAAFANASELGNLVRPLHPLQIVGLWPSGDFRIEPTHRVATAILLAVAAAMACAGGVFAIERRAVAFLAALGSAVFGGLAFVVFGAPWIGAKALAIGSPIVLLSAFVGCACLASLRPRLRWVTLRSARVAGLATAAVLALGVTWSNALAYHDVDLAPRAQLAELERIGKKFAGQGPALMTEYQPYGVRHFLRDLDAEGSSELRRRPIALRSGSLAGKGEYVDIDQLQLGALLVYRTLVLRRSPVESRPPAPYRLVWEGRWYEVWQAQTNAAVVAHLPLGGPLEPAAVPPCTTVARLAGMGRTIAPPRPLNLVWPLTSAAPPAGWARVGDAFVPGRSGTLLLSVDLRSRGRYRLWVGGSIRGTLEAAVDGKKVGHVSSQLQNAGQWLELGSVDLGAGSHLITLAVEVPVLAPGSGGGTFPLGPLLLQPESRLHLFAPSRPRALCGRTLDWVEALA
jgi:hypothetical protein